jgi:AAA domain-containing protein
VRIAISGSHGTGKSTLIADFLAARPDYLHEPEAFESLSGEVELSEDEGPTEEGLRVLLEHTLAAVAAHGPGARVVFERSPVDYLAYAAASRSAWKRAAVAEFLSAHVPIVKASLRRLELIAYLPISPDGLEGRPGEDARFRRRVDRCLRQALLEDEYDLLDDSAAPAVVELPPQPERQLAELVRLTEAE